MKRTRKPKPTITGLLREVESLKKRLTEEEEHHRQSMREETTRRQRIEFSEYQLRQDKGDLENRVRNQENELHRLRWVENEMERVHGLLDLLSDAPPRSLEKDAASQQVWIAGPTGNREVFPRPGEIPAATRLAAWLAKRPQ